VEKVLDSVEDDTYDPANKDGAYYFGVIWTIDEKDAWDDPVSWLKANPSLGSVKPYSEIEIGVDAARASEGSRRAFMRDHLNVWQATDAERFMDMDKWRDCHQGDPVPQVDTWARLAGLPCWFGLDPSSARDITALCAIADDPNEEGAILAAWDFWVPGENLSVRIAKENLPYDLWAREGWVKTTDGACIDINVIKEQCLMRKSQVELISMGYDEGMSQGIGISLLNDHGYPCAKVGQGYWLSPALQEIERLTLAGKLKHFGNPVAQSHAAATIVFKGDSRIKLSKGKSKSRIDGMAALAMAFSARQETMANGILHMGAGLI
jgi:phage terminase large subunit-like protein